jgi:FkbM family methyltransferase
VAFTDNDSRLWNTSVEGVAVLSPEDAARRYADSAAFVVTIWRGEGTDRMRNRMDQLLQLGCRTVVSFMPLFWKYAEAFLPHYAVDLPHRVVEQADRVTAAFDTLEDDASRREFVAGVRWRTWGDFDSLGEPVATEIYFPEDLFTLSATEVFVDCGAFDGDTIRRFFSHVKPFEGAIKAFEPDPSNCARLRAYVAGLPPSIGARITVFPYAVGKTREIVRFDATGTESAAVGAGSLEIESVPLDEVLADSRPTYIKMDTEGSEVDALEGARQVIGAHRPRLALCVYHRQNHLWEIPLSILRSYGGYRMFLRPQLLEGWDLVCYAMDREEGGR